MNTKPKLNTLLFVSVIACASTLAWAKDEQKTQTQEQAVYGWQLMTEQERNAHREKMRQLKTEQDRDQYRQEHHNKMQARAKERGVELPPHAKTI